MARRNKPHDPASATRLATERRQREDERKRLVESGATVRLDAAGRIISAYRSNVFTLLLQRGTITPNHHDAASTLATTWAAWKGLDGKPEGRSEAVDGGSGCAELVTDRMIRAGKDVKWVFSQLTLGDAKLLTAFMVATVEEDRAMVWRGIVERVHGPGLTEKQQTQAVVTALESLRCVYQEPGRVAA